MIDASKTGVVIALFFAGLAVSFTGTPQVGYSSQCTDGLDNDNDGFTDIQDLACILYPYADNPSTNEEFRGFYSSGSSYLSLFEYHYDNAQTTDQYNYAYCRAIEQDPQTGTHHYPTDEDAQAAYDYAIQNLINCLNYP